MPPSGSAASAVSVTVAGAVKTAPSAGLVIDTVGGWFAWAWTLADRASEVVAAPPLSWATAVRVYRPCGTLLHVKEYGVVDFEPSSVPPSKKSTLLIVPSVSAAAAAMVIVAGA